MTSHFKEKCGISLKQLAYVGIPSEVQTESVYLYSIWDDILSSSVVTIEIVNTIEIGMNYLNDYLK